MKKILVIDDDQFFAKTLMAALPEGKYNLASAENGEEGLTKMKTSKPDLIILDILMPKMDGPSFLKTIKADPEFSAIPVLVSSNLSSLKKVSDMMTLGATGYIIKSDESLESIIQDIERILSQTNG
ncbi:MAG: response regulator [Patescibacteria group bacterium]